MQKLLFFGLWFVAIAVQAQSTTRFETSIEAQQDGYFRVENVIHFTLDEALGMVPLEAIRYEASEISGVSVDGKPAKLIEYNHLWKIEWYEKVKSPLRVTYQVRSDDDFANIPMLMLPWKPTGTPEDLFTATIKIPEDYIIKDQFPTIPFEQLNEREYRFQLPVVSSLVRLKLSKDDGIEWGRTKWIDALVIVLLLGLGVLGWVNRHKMNS